MKAERLEEAELVIVGAGPGGISAAVAAADAGIFPVVVDENHRLGGKIYSQHHEEFKIIDGSRLGPDYERGRQFLEKLSRYREKIRFMKDATIFGIFDGDKLMIEHERQGQILRFKRLILATGAYDRPVPFPGWTLPGVMTAGGAQTLVKMQRVLPGRKILLAGTGPLQLVLASQIISAGGEIAEILEAGDIENWLEGARGFWKNWDFLKDGIFYLNRIRKAGVPIHRRHIILQARGNERVEEAVVAEVDSSWNPLKGTERTVRTDAVCLGYGLIPSVELTRLAGCRHEYEPRLGGWIPSRNEDFETTVPGVYAVGDSSGVAGSQAALQEGPIAGMAAAQALWYLSESEKRSKQQPYRKRLKNLSMLRKTLDDISVPKPGLYNLATDDTLICRCEEITLGEVKAAIEMGITDMDEIKRFTRMGMGRCQGRMCGLVVQEIVAQSKGVSASQIGYLHQRPPVKPVLMSTLESIDDKNLTEG